MGQGIVRSLKFETELVLGIKTETQSAILSWLARHAAFVLLGCSIRRRGRTAFEELRMLKYESTCSSG